MYLYILINFCYGYLVYTTGYSVNIRAILNTWKDLGHNEKTFDLIEK